MKTVKILGLLMASTFILFSCEKKEDSADVSRVTNFPTFDFQGDELILHPLGTPYTDPGVSATEGGSVIDVSKSVLGQFRFGSVPSVDENMADRYLVTYSAENQDGFAGNTTREVWVAETGDLVSSIEGLYISTIVRNGVVSAQYSNLEYVLIWKNSDGTYGISDAIGGYYMFGRPIGINYAAQGVSITANDIPNNDFSFAPSDFPVGVFGGTANITSFTVDPTAKTINFLTDWNVGASNFKFDVTLEQVQL